MKSHFFLKIIGGTPLLFSLFLVSCSNKSKLEGIKAIFSTKEEAEKAAPKFNCSGAHKMGDYWMPCQKNEGTQSNKMHTHHQHGQ